MHTAQVPHRQTCVKYLYSTDSAWGEKYVDYADRTDIIRGICADHADHSDPIRRNTYLCVRYMSYKQTCVQDLGHTYPTWDKYVRKI